MGKRKTAVAVEHGNRLPEVAVISLSLVVSSNTMAKFLTGEVYIIVNTASQRKIWASSLQMNICCEIEMAPLLRAEVQIFGRDSVVQVDQHPCSPKLLLVSLISDGARVL